ncbi:MAG: FHA domain-containing protein [Chloroflexota bacterium]
MNRGDTGSTNSTRINGATLHADRAYRLRNGDEIEFGTLRTVIRFLR